MKIIPPLFSLLLLATVLLQGCQSPQFNARLDRSVAQATRNNCYSLLHQLLEEERGVSLLRFIKNEQPGSCAAAPSHS